MIFRSVLLSMLLLSGRALADDAATPPTAKEMLRARLAEETSANPGTAPAGATKSTAPAPANPGPVSPGALATPAPKAAADKNPLLTTTAPTTATTDQAAKAKPEPTTILPKVEVNRRRITVLDQELAKEDQQIAREKKNTKPTELDKAINNDKITKPLAIFGGESSSFRKQVSSERVGLMEDEKDLLEAIAAAKTKEEKAELKKQLDALREERRLLEQAER